MKKLILLSIPVMLIAFVFMKNDDFTISGTVNDAKGQPIAFANVMDKRTLEMASADNKGKYSLKLTSENATLVFSAVGYISKEVKVNRRHVIDVTLDVNVRALIPPVGISLDSTNVSGNTAKGLYTVPAGTNYCWAPTTNGALYSTGTGYVTLSTSTFNDADEYHNTENYDHISENGFHKVTDDPLSTFSIDVDAASYSNIRRYLNGKQLPPAGAVRIEEMINYFKYDYPAPVNNQPFSISTEMSDCPWNHNNKLLMIGLQGKQIPVDDLPASNLVFLIDVSGSMEDENKLPLVKSSLKLLTDQLRRQDKISMVVYAGSAGVVLPATAGDQKQRIKTAIDALEAGGSTAGGEGIKLAYNIARKNFAAKGNNRVILCTDGDFNVGASSDDDMVRLIEKERESGVFLTVLGYGMGNYKDNKMQQLADKGNGNHAYIDGLTEAKKVLVNEFGGTLFTIAKDVKLQIEFNPAKIAGYRLIGYENRILNKEDFKDDKKDAGELGSGHTVTALYELIPAGVYSAFLGDVDPLKYQQKGFNEMPEFSSDELLTVKFRYKEPAGTTSQLIEHPVKGDAVSFTSASDNLRFVAAVAGFGMLLRNSEFKGSCSFNHVIEYAGKSIGNDKEGYRKEFISLMKTARDLSNKTEIEDLSGSR